MAVGRSHHHRHVGRRLHSRLGAIRLRPKAGSLALFAAVVGPGVLAGLSDDDPAGITTYSILGAKYRLAGLDWWLTGAALALVAASIATLALLTIF